MLTEVESHQVPRGMTRLTMISGWNIPFTWFLVVLGLPISLVLVNKNVFWLGLIPVLTILARRASDDKDNNPRVTWLALMSGFTFAERSKDGTDTVDASTPGNGMGLLHD